MPCKNCVDIEDDDGIINKLCTRRCLKDEGMHINTKYNIGDIVYYVHGFSYSFQVVCRACNQTGKVILNNGTTTKCGECSGTGEHRVERPYKIRPQKGKIVEVIYSTKTGTEYRLDSCEFPKKDNDLFLSFFEARQKAHSDNSKYGWPKMDFDRWKEGGYFAHLEYPNRCYWGIRLRKKLTYRNVK